MTSAGCPRQGLPRRRSTSLGCLCDVPSGSGLGAQQPAALPPPPSLLRLPLLFYLRPLLTPRLLGLKGGHEPAPARAPGGPYPPVALRTPTKYASEASVCGRPKWCGEGGTQKPPRVWLDGAKEENPTQTVGGAFPQGSGARKM